MCYKKWLTVWTFNHIFDGSIKCNEIEAVQCSLMQLFWYMLRFTYWTILMWDVLFSWSGIKIAGGRSALGADFGIFVKKVLSGGVADLDGKHRNYLIRLSVSCLSWAWHKARVKPQIQ